MTDKDTQEMTASEVAEQLEQIRQNSVAYNEIDGFGDSFEGFVREVVENGTFVPDATLTAEVGLSVKERLTGKRSQDVTAMVALGMMLGAALERDVPADSELETAWKNGEFTFPDE